MNKILRFFLFLFFAFLFVALSLFYLYKKDYFQINVIQIQVDEQKFHTQLKKLNQYEQIKNLKENLEKFYKFSFLGKVDITKIKNSILSQNKWIEALIINRQWPDKLVIHLIPKEIKAILLNKNSDFFPVANDGVLLEKIKNNQLPDLIIFKGECFEKDILFRKKAIKILQQIPEEGGIFSKENVSEISISKEKDFWLLLIPKKILVKLNKEEELTSQKITKINKVLDYIDKNNVEAKIIDARFPEKVLVKLRKEKK